MKLRPYQENVISEFFDGLQQGHTRQLVALPTGSGKTITASEIIHRTARTGRTSLFIVDRIQLVDQGVATLSRHGLNVGVMQGERTSWSPTDDCVVCSVQTIRARRAPPADFIVIDEAHVLHRAHIRLLEAWNAVPTLGLSATPLRPDLGKYFSNLIRGPSVRELTDMGALVPAKAYCPSSDAMKAILASVRCRGGDFAESELSGAMTRKELVGDTVRTWQQLAADRQTLVFAVDIAHSKSIIADFVQAGVIAAHIDAYTPRQTRADIVSRFRSGDLQILSSVNVLGVGFDAPEASCGILARPTLSEIVDMQQKRRLIRPAPGKSDALLLDHAGNCLRFGLPTDFHVTGLGEQEHVGTKAKRKQTKMTACTNCGFAMEPGQMTCPACGIDRPDKRSKVVYRDGRLVELGSNDDGSEQYTRSDKRNWYLSFLWYARHKQRKSGWTFFAYRAKFNDEKPPWSWRDLPLHCPDDEQARWLKYYELRTAKAWQKRQSAGR